MKKSDSYENDNNQAKTEQLEIGNICTPGSHLPNNSNRCKSYISGRLIKGTGYILEDGETTIEQNEAIMWAKVTPYSPLCTGHKINSF